MTEPRPDGPYPNSIRSDSSSGLGGIWSQLALLLNAFGALPQLLEAVQQIRDDLRYLVGPPQEFVNEWPGLPLYFRRVLGEEVERDGSSIGNQPVLNSSALQLLQQVRLGLLGNQGPPQFDRLGGINAGLIAINGRVFSLENITGEQLAAMGALASVPSGKTIKVLLDEVRTEAERQADCCEAGSEEPPPDEPVNDPPVNFGCPNGQRVTAWVSRGTTTVGGEDRWLWQARFDTPPAGISQFVASGGQATSYRLAAVETKYDLCIAWNFQGNSVVVDAFGRNRSNLSGTAATDTFTSGPVASGSSFILGGLVDELSSCDDPNPDDDACGYMFRTTTNAAPALNVWLSSIERNCAV